MDGTGEGWPIFDLRRAGARFFVSMLLGVVATFATPGTLPLHIRAVVGWDTSALTFVVLAWMIIARATPSETRARAAMADPGRRIVSFVAVASALVSLFASLTVLHAIKSLPAEQVPVWTGLALAAVILSWTVTHTTFTLRYAHLYYRQHGDTHCLEFPDTREPSDSDFAYFAFTIGMCFQVSDVTVRSRAARRVVLLHSLLAFVHNTTILAVSLNLLTSVVQ
ncbi:MAG: DUF1345 domain-containing protein [Polyangiaceae bacterium]